MDYDDRSHASSHEKRLEERVLQALRPAVGAELVSVSYGVLEGECEPQELHEPNFYFGGEITLGFRGDNHGNVQVVVTWDENAGWPLHFSIQARTNTSSVHGGLEALDGSTVPVWKPHFDTKLRAVRVHGFQETPHVLEFLFDSASIAIATSSQLTIGDGDDVTIRSDVDLAAIDKLRLITIVERR